MISRPKFSCGRGLRIRVAIEPEQHRRVLGDVEQEVTEISKRVVAEHFDLTADTAGILAWFRRHVARGFCGADKAGNLRVAGGEVVVPEERHLLLKRTIAMDHPEQPALSCLCDVRSWSEFATARQHVPRLPNLAVHIVGDALVLDEARHRSCER
jgi:hypothetical protein